MSERDPIDRQGWGFALAALVAGLFALAIVILLILGLRGLF